jgi:hypothetical protein
MRLYFYYYLCNSLFQNIIGPLHQAKYFIPEREEVRRDFMLYPLVGGDISIGKL